MRAIDSTKDLEVSRPRQNYMNAFTVQVNLKHIRPIWIKFYAAVRLFVLFYFFIHTFLVKFMKSLYSVIKHKMKQKEKKKERSEGGAGNDCLNLNFRQNFP